MLLAGLIATYPKSSFGTKFTTEPLLNEMEKVPRSTMLFVVLKVVSDTSEHRTTENTLQELERTLEEFRGCDYGTKANAWPFQSCILCLKHIQFKYLECKNKSTPLRSQANTTKFTRLSDSTKYGASLIHSHNPTEAPKKHGTAKI